MSRHKRSNASDNLRPENYPHYFRASTWPLPHDADELLASMEPKTNSTECIYLSTPITTGPPLQRLLDPNREGGRLTLANLTDSVRSNVIEENLLRFEPVRAGIRSQFPSAHLIDPTQLTMPNWQQLDYHRFWIEVIRRFADRVVFADGWELSTGCTLEFMTAALHAIPTFDASPDEFAVPKLSGYFTDAIATLEHTGQNADVASEARDLTINLQHVEFKDEILSRLADNHNVARFVSFTPSPATLRTGKLGTTRFRRSSGAQAAIEALLSKSATGQVNVRTFKADSPKGNPFYYGVSSADDVLDLVNRSSAEGLFSIVNETIDVHDGGVSGVLLGGIAEFAPDSTPRGVDGPGATRLPVDLAQKILQAVYGSDISLPTELGARVEFSIHPNRVGHRSEKAIIWERENSPQVTLTAEISWPNSFSRMLGDKIYGLLVADALGLCVPRTTVINRRVAPFTFGRATESGEWWTRTAPRDQAPGLYPTLRGWTDPFALMEQVDPDNAIASVMAQESVRADFSGATVPRQSGGHIIEGVPGNGEDFMLGVQTHDRLPESTVRNVEQTLEVLSRHLGPEVRIEWAATEDQVWVLQLHCHGAAATAGVFHPGSPQSWLKFDPSEGLPALKELLAHASLVGAGIEVTRNIGLTSHVGDLIRKAGIPGRLCSDPQWVT